MSKCGDQLRPSIDTDDIKLLSTKTSNIVSPPPIDAVPRYRLRRAPVVTYKPSFLLYVTLPGTLSFKVSVSASCLSSFTPENCDIPFLKTRPSNETANKQSKPLSP